MAVNESGVQEREEEAEQVKQSQETTVKEAAEGFQTASEGEEEEEDGGDKDQVKADESKQKALAQANDAKVEGNQLYVAGKFDDALLKYELALYFAPELPSSVELRSICHSNRAVCFLKQGKYEEAIKECTKALELNVTNLRALIRRGEAHEKLDHFDECIADMKKILELDPSNAQARETMRRLEPLAAEKRKKLEEEMIGKLKDMGNSLLGRFGMSLDNFVKDPKTGSYSMSSKR